MKLEINKKQLELLQFMVLHFECDDNEKLCEWGDGDSIDRERVRDILLDEFNLEVKEWA